MSSDDPSAQVPFLKSLYARVILLTVVCILIGEVLILAPSIGKARRDFLEDRIAAAYLGNVALTQEYGRPSPDLEQVVNERARVYALRVYDDGVAMPWPDWPDEPDATFDLRREGLVRGIWEAGQTLAWRGERLIRVLDRAPSDAQTTVDILVIETELYRELVAYLIRILGLSLVLSAIVGALFVAALHWGVLAPLARMTATTARFRANPMAALDDETPSRRGDELGVVERELWRMRKDVREALHQQTRLAALGRALGMINHDLRNILSSALLISDRLERSQDPSVRQVLPRLVETLERAIRLCGDTLSFAKENRHAPKPRRFDLVALAREVADLAMGLAQAPPPVVVLGPVELVVWADRDQLQRVLENLVRNAREAIGEGPGEVRIRLSTQGREVQIDVEDDGPGIPDRVLPLLFEVFRSGGKAGGTGLGLAISREIVRAHGGDVVLVSTGPSGTRFRVRLPLLEPRTVLSADV